MRQNTQGEKRKERRSRPSSLFLINPGGRRLQGVLTRNHVVLDRKPMSQPIQGYSNTSKLRIRDAQKRPFQSHSVNATGVRNRILQFTHGWHAHIRSTRASLINHQRGERLVLAEGFQRGRAASSVLATMRGTRAQKREVGMIIAVAQVGQGENYQQPLIGATSLRPRGF